MHGTARLCRDARGVRVELHAENIRMDSAYTVWFIYFDTPAMCVSSGCDSPDLIGENPAGVFGRLDSFVSDRSVRADFEGSVRGLRLASGSEVQLPIFWHGPAVADDTRARARQLLTPQVPMLGAPGLGVPADGDRGVPHAIAVFDIP
jgi:hypothetical protein